MDSAVTPASLLTPWKARRCTDCCCLFVFILSIIVAVIIAIAAAQVGDPDRLFYGTDFANQICGVDLPEKPYVYYPRLEQDLSENMKIVATAPWALPLYGVCVARCPDEGEQVRDYICDGGSSLCKWSRNSLVAYDETNVWHVSVPTVGLMHRCFPITDTDDTQISLCGYPTCHEANERCYRSSFTEEGLWVVKTDKQREGCEQFVDLQISTTKKPPHSNLVTEFVGGMVGGSFGVAGDLVRARFEIGIFGILVAVVLNFVVLLLLRCCLKPLFYLTLFLLILLVVVLTVVLFAKGGVIDLGGFTSQSVVQLNAAFVASGFGSFNASTVETAPTDDDAYAALFGPHETNATLFQIAAYISLICLVIIIVLTVIVWPKLSDALEIVSTATSAIFAMPFMMMMPLVSLAAAVAAIAAFALVLINFVTPDPHAVLRALDDFIRNFFHGLDFFANSSVDTVVGAFNQSGDDLGLSVDTSSALPYVNLTASVDEAYFAIGGVIFEAFVATWIVFFIDAIAYTSIAGATVYWYSVESQPKEERDESMVQSHALARSIGRVFRFHLGSMAMGSGILALVRTVRYVMVVLDERTKELQASSMLAKFAMKCVHCVLWCFEKSIKFITRFAYVFIGATGDNFCKSAVRTFKLVVEHPLQMAANELSLWVFVLLQTLLTPLACALLAYFSIVKEWRFAFSDSLEVSLRVAAEGIGGALNASATASDVLDATDNQLDALKSWGVSVESNDVLIPPNAVAVAVAVLLLAYVVTSLFKVVCVAAIDTIFVCKFVDDLSFGGSLGANKNLDAFSHERHAPKAESVIAP